LKNARVAAAATHPKNPDPNHLIFPKTAMKRLILFTVLGALAAQGAIKKGEGSKPAPLAEQPAPAPKPEAPKPADKPKETPGPGSLLDELLKRRPKNGQVELKGEDLERIFREHLERMGAPKEELKGLNLLELMRKLREMDPDGAKGLKFPGLDEFGEMLGFQLDRKLADKLNEHFKQLLDGHRPGTAKAATSTVAFRDAKKEKEPLILGTVVRADGWVLTKATEVAKIADLQCQVNGTWMAAKIARVWDNHDLALVKVSAKDLPIIQWATSPSPGVGTFVTAAAPAGAEPVAIGVVSVAARNLHVKGQGFLGVRLGMDDKGLKIGEIVAGAPASNAGLLKDDRVLEVDGKKADSPYAFTKMVSDRKAGEKIKLKLQRGAEVLEKEIQLGDRASQAAGLRRGADKLNGMGSTISKRKDDFPSVVQTDLPLEAYECGGPVTDLDGNVVGLVIARSGRIETLIIPSETIRRTLAEVDFAKEEAAAAKVEVKK
jgi:S1-C subfamily serine protease